MQVMTRMYSSASMVLKLLGALLSQKKEISLQSYNECVVKGIHFLIHACSEKKKIRMNFPLKLCIQIRKDYIHRLYVYYCKTLVKSQS